MSYSDDHSYQSRIAKANEEAVKELKQIRERLGWILFYIALIWIVVVAVVTIR